VAPERILLRANSFSAQMQAVRSGVGVKLVAEPFLGLDGVTKVKLSPDLDRSLRTLPTASLWLVGHRALRNVPRVAAVWSFLLETFRETNQSSD